MEADHRPEADEAERGGEDAADPAGAEVARLDRAQREAPGSHRGASSARGTSPVSRVTIRSRRMKTPARAVQALFQPVVMQ